MPEQRDTGRPEGAQHANRYSSEVLETCGDHGLGGIIDWDEYDGADLHMDGSGIRARGRHGRGGGMFNAFPGVPGAEFHPVMHVTLPIDAAPAFRPAEAHARTRIYYAAAMSEVAKWATHHLGEGKPDPIELHLLTEAWPLMPLHEHAGVQSRTPPFMVDDEDFWIYRQLRRRRGFLNWGSIEPHAMVGSIARRLPALTIHVQLVVGRKRSIALPVYSGRNRDWPAGW